MTEPSPGLGGWDPDMSAAGPEWQAATPAQQQAAIEAAVRTVWTLSGCQYGTAEVLVAPWVPYVPPYYYRPYALNAGLWASGAPTYMEQRVDRGRRLLLPGPVVDDDAHPITVTIGEVVLPRGEEWEFEVTGHLTRRAAAWPVQDLNWPTFTVRFTRGRLVPLDGLVAVAVLAERRIRSRAKPSPLPERTRDVQRQGVSVSVSTPEEVRDKGFTGVKEVDDFVAAVNPDRLVAPPAVWSPELARHRFLRP